MYVQYARTRGACRVWGRMCSGKLSPWLPQARSWRPGLNLPTRRLTSHPACTPLYPTLCGLPSHWVLCLSLGYGTGELSIPPCRFHFRKWSAGLCGGALLLCWRGSNRVWHPCVGLVAWRGEGNPTPVPHRASHFSGQPCEGGGLWNHLFLLFCQGVMAAVRHKPRSGVKGPREGGRVREGRRQGAAPNGHATRVTSARWV